MSHGRQPEVKSFLFWSGFAPYHGQENSCVYVYGLTLQTRWRQNAPKREKYSFRLTSVAQKRLCLSSLIKYGAGNCSLTVSDWNLELFISMTTSTASFFSISGFHCEVCRHFILLIRKGVIFNRRTFPGSLRFGFFARNKVIFCRTWESEKFRMRNSSGN